ncbi:MAG: hypothetical protein RIR08_870 [Pseudomonadota bacterium]
MGSFTVVIPARLASSRLERKALADLGGKPMVVRVAERSAQSAANRIIVATDAQEIESVCKAANLEVMMTREDHPSGTDRLAEVALQLGLNDEAIVVNVQGDEPLIPVDLINQVANTLQSKPHCAMATAAVAIHDQSEIAKIYYRHLGIYAYRTGFLKAFSNLAISPLEQAECLQNRFSESIL